MSFEDIPEDLEQSFPCGQECGGSVSKDSDGFWCCDTCDWTETDN